MSVSHIRLLGSMEVVRGDGSTPVRGSVPRALLARLAWSPGETVGTDRLIADVWADPPEAAGGTLRAHVSRLRSHALGTAIVGTAGGYRLDVPRDRVDVARLRDRIAALPDGPADEARLAELTDLALQLGVDLAPGLTDPPFLMSARRTLAAERRGVEEDLGETALDLGDNALAVAVLEGTVARNPGHERPARLLATALARQSRFSDAVDVLDAYVEGLEAQGVEPPSGVASLRLSIVRLEPAVVAPAAASAGTVARYGMQLPLTRFVGRSGLLGALRAARPTERLLTLVGPAGVGKTRTAVELAREATTALDEEQYMVDLADVRLPEAVVPAVATSVRAMAPTPEAIAQRLAGRRVLIVLDNADHVLRAAADAARDLLEGAPGVRLLVTSREPLGLADERVVAVPPFDADDEDAWRLFVERASDARGGDPFEDAEAETARLLCAELDGIPLALELAAARLDVLDAAAVRSGLGAWAGEGRHGSVQSAIAWSFDLLDADLQRALVHAGRFAGPFTVEAFAGVEGIAVEEADRILRVLEGKSLLSPERSDTGRPRLRMLESTREFVARRDDPDEAAAWTARHRRWFTDLVWSLAPTLRAFEARDTMAELDAFRADLDAAMDSAVVAGDADAALRLTGGMAHHWYLRGRLQEGRTRIEQALAVPVARADADTDADADDDAPPHPAAPAAELELAMLAYQLGDAATAFGAISAAEAHGRAIDDASVTAVALARAGYGRSLFGDRETGRQLMEAASSFADAALPWARSEVLMSEGQMLRSWERHDEAIAALSESYRIAASIGYTWMVTSSLYVLAKTLLDLKRPREAIAVAEDAAVWAHRNEDLAARLALLHVVAGACAAVDRSETGARLFGALDALGERYGYSTANVEGADAERMRDAVAESLPRGAFERLYEEGRGLEWDDVVALVRRLPHAPGPIAAGPVGTAGGERTGGP